MRKLMCLPIAVTLAGIMYAGCLEPVEAQNIQCTTRPAGDSTNACASTAFVQSAVTAASGTVVPCAGVDDTTALQAAVTAGGTVIPVGTCVTTSSITVSLSYTRIIGKGRGTSKIQSSATASAVVVNTGLTGIEITDLQVLRTDIAPAGRDCIHFNNLSERVYIARVDVVGCYNGLRLGITSFSVVEEVLANNNQNHGIYLTNADGAGGLQWQLFNNISQQNNGYGFFAEATTSDASLGDWINNYTYANKLNGMRFVGTAGTPFRLQGPRLLGGFLGQDCADEIFLDTYSTVAIQIEGVYTELAGTSACGVNLGTAATNVGKGISISANNTNVALTNNVVIQNSQNGIQSAASFAQITGNTTRLNGQAAGVGQQSGIQIDAGVVTVTGNTSIANTQFGVRILVDGTTVVGNNLCSNTSASFAAIALSTSLIENNSCQNAGAITTVAGALTLVNGLNSNITNPGGVFSYLRISGPTGAFSVGGLVGGTDGRVMRLFNTTSQTMTLVNADASSTAANQITTLSGANVVLPATSVSFATLIYDGTTSRWILTSTNVAGTSTVANAQLAQMATNTVKGNATSGTANPTDLAVGTCSTSTSALIWTTNTGFGCNTFGTVVTRNTGTSGTTVPLLDGTNTYSGVSTFSNTTDASAIGTAAVVLSGGLSIAKTTIHGSTIGIGAAPFTGSIFSNLLVQSAQAGNSYAMYMSPTLTPATANQAYFGFFAGTIATGASNTIGYGVGLYVDALAKSGTGTVTNAYGLYVQPQTIGGTNNYSGYFGGKVTIGAETTTAGGLGVAQTTASTSKTTGSAVFGGGIGIAGATYTDTLNIITVANASTTAALCWNSGTGLVTENAAVGTCTVSDERLKNMGPRITDALDKLLKINGVYYTWKDPTFGSGRQIGVGAQTVEKVFPELVSTDSEGKMSADYLRLTAPIIEAIRELDSKVKRLERRVIR